MEEEVVRPNVPQEAPPEVAKGSEAPMESPINSEVRPSSPPPSAEVLLSPRLSPHPISSTPHPSPPSSPWLPRRQSPEETIGAPSAPERLPEEPVSPVLSPWSRTRALPASGPEVIIINDDPKGVPP